MTALYRTLLLVANVVFLVLALRAFARSQTPGAQGTKAGEWVAASVAVAAVAVALLLHYAA